MKNATGFLRMSRQNQGKHTADNGFQKVPSTGLSTSSYCRTVHPALCSLLPLQDFFHVPEFSWRQNAFRANIQELCTCGALSFSLSTTDNIWVSMECYSRDKQQKEYITHLETKYSVTGSVQLQQPTGLKSPSRKHACESERKRKRRTSSLRPYVSPVSSSGCHQTKIITITI